jgi:FkbM family methyltransferase
MSLAPIILFVYNRPWHTEQTLESLKKNYLADESVLHIYADGPKAGLNQGGLGKVMQVREIIRKKQWCKEVRIYESEVNRGLADSIISGVTQIVKENGKVIVLEDDLLLSKGFLRYMNDALDLYALNEDVMHVSGYMFPVNAELPETFFYNTASCWGWGTWQRAWKKFEPDAKAVYDRILASKKVKEFNKDGADFFSQLELNVQGKIKTWAVRWYATIFFNKGFSLHPGKSLVNNIGLDNSGENCGTSDSYKWHYLVEKINVEPIEIKESKEARSAMKRFYKQLPEKSFLNRVKSSIPPRIKKIIFNRIRSYHQKKLLKIPRYTSFFYEVFGVKIKVIDSTSFVFSFDEIFNKELYKFQTENAAPFIVDCGANIGLSIIYFKRLYPNAEVIAFEPDPKVFEVLKYNIEQFGFKNVVLVNKALWNEETTLSFFSEGADSNRIAKDNDESNLIKIKTTELKKVLNRHVDFLKMDIEGAEAVVLEDCVSVLKNVDKAFIEYHSFQNEPQQLDRILIHLKENGFRTYIQNTSTPSVQPFMQINTFMGMDNQLNIFAYKEK